MSPGAPPTGPDLPTPMRGVPGPASGPAGPAAPDTFPRTTRVLREALEARGLAPAKRHGQCFLTDVQAIDAIVRDAQVGPGDAVLEVGTGTGLLTHALCEAGASVDTFDIDPKMVTFAQSLRTWPERIRFHLGDVLEGKHALSADLLGSLAAARRTAGPGHVHVVSNLPYNAATPVVLGLLALQDPPDRMTVLIQREMADKFLAAPGTESYGAPSILRALAGEGRITRRLPPQVFWPAPKVQSAVLQLTPRRSAPLDPALARAFAAFLIALFTRRRKVLPTALQVAVPELTPGAAREALSVAGLDPGQRAEDTAPEDLRALFLATRGSER